MNYNFDEVIEFVNVLESVNPNEHKLIKLYTDGSYSNKLKKSAYGIVIKDQNDLILAQCSGFSFGPKWIEQWNVSAEKLGFLKGIMKIHELGIKDCTILYGFDYVGLEGYSKKEIGKLNELLNSKYKLMHFKIRGHTGNSGNERTDQLASYALHHGVNKND